MKPRFKVTKRRALVAVVALVTVAAVGAAIAAWLISSQGGGKSQVGTLTAPTVTPSASAPAGRLFPGADGDVGLHIVNPNGPMVLTGIMLGTNGAYESSGDPTGCPSSFVTVNTLNGLSIPVPAGTSDVTVPGGFHLDAQAPTECQGVVITKPVKATFSTP